MAAGIYPLRKFQVGVEATPGTAVPATWFMAGDAVVQHQLDRYFSDYPRGVRMAVTGGGVPIMQQANITYQSELTFEEILYPLGTGLATPTVAGAGADKTWTVNPVLTGNPAQKTFTGEWVVSDGASNLIALKSAFGYTSGFDVEWAFNQIARLTWRSSLRAPTYAITPTPSLTVMTGREQIPSNLFKVYMDDTWAGLGTTQLVGTIRSGRLSVNTGITPDYTTDGRPTQDFTQLKWGDNVSAALQLVMELNANGAGEVTNWINQNQGGASQKNRFFRFEATSPNVLGTSARRIRLDGSYIYSKEPAFSQQGKQELITFDLVTEYDPTSAKGIAAAVVNSLASFT